MSLHMEETWRIAYTRNKYFIVFFFFLADYIQVGLDSNLSIYLPSYNVKRKKTYFNTNLISNTNVYTLSIYLPSYTCSIYVLFTIFIQ